MELNDLNIFQTVATEKSISKAAHKLGYAQSNISMRVKILEDELNTKLFIRSVKGSELTTDGEMLLDYTLQIDSIIQNIQDHFGISQTCSAFKIGAPQTILAAILPRSIHAFKSEFPQSNFELIAITSSQSIQPLLSKQIDLGLFYEVNSKDVEIISEIYENAILISPNSSHSESLDLPLIINSDPNCPYRKIAFTWAKAHNKPINNLFYFDTLESIVNSVERGLGVSIIPESLSKNHTKLTVSHLDKIDTMVSIKICMRKTSISNHLLMKFACSISNNDE